MPGDVHGCACRLHGSHTAQVVIGRIDPAGAAHFSGLITGDHLLSINGAAVEDVSSAVGQQGLPPPSLSGTSGLGS